MKRLFILASAAIVALASCARTEVVYNDTPEEIGFKAVTGAVTRAEQTSATLEGDMGVFAYVHGTTNQYFENAKFTESDGLWAGGMYWPVNHKLDFVAYAPWVAGTTYDYTNKVLTIAADNSANTVIGNQVDYLYGDAICDNSGAGYDKETVSVPVTLKHAQAKVTVSFDIENVTITDVQLVAPVLKGTCQVTYGDPVSVVWAGGTANDAVKLIETTDVDAQASLLVIPNTKTNISFNYQIKGSEAELPYTITVASVWEPGTHYTYNVKVTPTEIKFNPTVSNTWATGSTTDTVL